MFEVDEFVLQGDGPQVVGGDPLGDLRLRWAERWGGRPSRCASCPNGPSLSPTPSRTTRQPRSSRLTPLWSAVLAATGTHEALQLHRDLAERLQRQVPNDDAELLAQVTAECALLRRQG
jgi:hypothetical protein